MTRNDVDTQTLWQFKVIFVSLKTLVKHLNKWSIINLIYLNFNPWWLCNRFWDSGKSSLKIPFVRFMSTYFNSNKLYGAKSQATALFRHQTARRSSLMIAMLRFNQFHPMITRKSICYGWSQHENQNKLQEDRSCAYLDTSNRMIPHQKHMICRGKQCMAAIQCWDT